MNVEQIAGKLVALCREGRFDEAHNSLYAEHAVSIEPEAIANVPGMLGSVEGLAAIREKGRQFRERTEAVHAVTVSEPLVAGNGFSLSLSMDITMKQFDRMTMSEICVYHVHEGRIDREQFFYDVG